MRALRRWLGTEEWVWLDLRQEVTEEMKAAAVKKEEGNKFFAAGDYVEAERCFTEALKLTEKLDLTQVMLPHTPLQPLAPLTYRYYSLLTGHESLRNRPFVPQPSMSDARKQRAVFFNNRAAARANQGQDETVIEDTTCAIKLDYKYVKARLRRAQTHEEKGRIKEAYDDYKRAMSYEPSNKVARDGVDRLQPQVDEIAESKLIEITIPDVIPENRIITYNIPGHGEIELELPDDAQPGQTIKLQMEDPDEVCHCPPSVYFDNSKVITIE